MENFKVGDQVEIVNYGAIIYMFKDGVYTERDIQPNLIGMAGVICKAQTTQDMPNYGILFGPNDDRYWFDEGQLKLIHRPAYV